jgi:hypothetical protein
LALAIPGVVLQRGFKIKIMYFSFISCKLLAIPSRARLLNHPNNIKRKVRIGNFSPFSFYSVCLWSVLKYLYLFSSFSVRSQVSYSYFVFNLFNDAFSTS